MLENETTIITSGSGWPPGRSINPGISAQVLLRRIKTRSFSSVSKSPPTPTGFDKYA